MTNRQISSYFKLTADLLELHDANPFVIKSYSSITYFCDNVNLPLNSLNIDEIAALEGATKKSAEKIYSLVHTNTFDQFEELVNQTPKGVIELLKVKGLGPKKVKALWKEHQIDSVFALKEACDDGSLAKMKGFGAKTVESIRETLEFNAENRNKVLLSDGLILNNELLSLFRNTLGLENIQSAGEIIRKMPIITCLTYIIENISAFKLISALKKVDLFSIDEKKSSPSLIKGTLGEKNLPFEIKISTQIQKDLFIENSSVEHLNLQNDSKTISALLKTNPFESEEKIYQELGLPFIFPERRNGLDEFTNQPQLIQYNDLKGILHNHSTYSDGKHTLREMAEYCKELGFEYLGISDHSVTAFYAKGLEIERVIKQQEEIDLLNTELTPFTIFKGIESDILNDGSLDYPEEILKSFDFIVSSIHSNLTMDEETATKRLIKAIENPYTTILGHPTGRLLLKRKGYPLNFNKIIDACAANNVVIEINSNPRRLDLDWTWIPLALEKGVKLSINPDAHEKNGYHDMIYGVYMGQKGGLIKEQNLNSFSLNEIKSYFRDRK